MERRLQEAVLKQLREQKQNTPPWSKQTSPTRTDQRLPTQKTNLPADMQGVSPTLKESDNDKTSADAPNEAVQERTSGTAELNISTGDTRETNPEHVEVPVGDVQTTNLFNNI